MKKLFLLILVIVSLQSFSQYRLYAIRGNLDGTFTNYYHKALTDSLFDEDSVFVQFTVEHYLGGFNPAFPSSFGDFIKCADQIYRNKIAINGIRIMMIAVNSNAGANLVLTDQPNSEQPLANSLRSAVAVQSHGYTEARLTAIVLTLSASVNNPRIYFQYSTDGVNWTGDGTAGNVSLSSIGAKETAWIALPVQAIGNIYVRVASNGGNGAADPALGNVTIQLR